MCLFCRRQCSHNGTAIIPSLISLFHRRSLYALECRVCVFFSLFLFFSASFVDPVVAVLLSPLLWRHELLRMLRHCYARLLLQGGKPRRFWRLGFTWRAERGFYAGVLSFLCSDAGWAPRAHEVGGACVHEGWRTCVHRDGFTPAHEDWRRFLHKDSHTCRPSLIRKRSVCSKTDAHVYTNTDLHVYTKTDAHVYTASVIGRVLIMKLNRSIRRRILKGHFGASSNSHGSLFAVSSTCTCLFFIFYIIVHFRLFFFSSSCLFISLDLLSSVSSSLF